MTDAVADAESVTVAHCAARLRLPAPTNRWSEPWRHGALRYLHDLVVIADWEGTPFGDADILVALSRLRDDIIDLVALVTRRLPKRRSRWRR